MEEVKYADDDWMRGRYIIMGKLGEGGFGKVRKAIHAATNDTVAIKEMNKKKLGADIVHIRKEVEAMKNLTHQNICRLLQFVETKTDFYLVLEYCNGGEMFDYIVQKNKLTEPEARHFFRQLVQAIAFCHSKGYAHRDLKPENLLLKEDLRLKVIDFGLSSPLGSQLNTFCGSLCYAAPEILSVSQPLPAKLAQNKPYDGQAADIWSMGVLLYILVTGASPFNLDSQEQVMFAVKNGRYKIPSFVTESCKDLLRRMMEVSPQRRIKMSEILVHPWVKHDYVHTLKTSSVYSKDVIDEEIIRELASFEGVPNEQMARLVKEWRFDYVTATYLLLLQRKERRESISLPSYRRTCNVVNSPTIHASLEGGLDAETDHRFLYLDDVPLTRSPLRLDQRGKENIPVFANAETPKRSKAPFFVTPKRTGSLPRSTGCQPSTPTGSTPADSPKSRREPRSAVKSPRLGRRLFASLERKAPRVLDMITPRRHQPDRIKPCTNYANVSVTYSEDPEPIRDRLVQVLQKMGLTVKTNGWKISGTAQAGVSVELEVVLIEEMKKIGVKRKRINGDAFCYKKVCEEVLNMARLANPSHV